MGKCENFSEVTDDSVEKSNIQNINSTCYLLIVRHIFKANQFWSFKPFHFSLDSKRMKLVSWSTPMLALAMWMVVMATMCEAAPSDYSNYPNNIVCDSANWEYKCPPGATCVYDYTYIITGFEKGYCAFSSPGMKNVYKL